MSEMAASEDGVERAQAFFRVIERNILVSLSCKFNVFDLQRARDRIFVPNAHVNWGIFDNPYLFASRSLLDMFHVNKTGSIQKFIPEDQEVDFIFDDQAEKGIILQAWDSYITHRPDSIRHLYGATPRFEDDKKFLPLQAADFWAWWVRKWYQQGGREAFLKHDFGKWQIKRQSYPVIGIDFGEDQIAEAIASAARERIGPGRPIYDLKLNMDIGQVT